MNVRPFLRPVRSAVRSLVVSINSFRGGFWLRLRGHKVGASFRRSRGVSFHIARGGVLHIGKGVTIGRDTVFEIHPSGFLVLGDGVKIGGHCVMQVRGQVSIAARTEIGQGGHIYCGKSVTLGSDVLVAAYISLIDLHHRHDRLDCPISQQGMEEPIPIDVGDGAWLGTKATLMPGASVGEGAIIGANAVVTKTVPAFEVWVGIPAKFLKKRHVHPG